MGTEASLLEGPGSQTGGLTRWGDYTALRIDPLDDCTFWYTNEFLPANGSFNWSTFIGSFRFAGCGTPDFSISASPASQTVIAGGSTSYTVTVGAFGGFAGPVQLSVAGVPAGATASFTQASITGSGSSSLSVNSGAVATGSSPLTITGTGPGGTPAHSTSVTLVVNPAPVPDFTISATPASRTVTPGAGTTYTATIAAVNGFAGAVSLSVSGLPNMAATGSFSPASVTGSGPSTLTVTTTSAIATGSYPLTVTGTSGSLTHSANVTLVVNPAPVPDFTISATPASQTVTPGGSTTYTATITAVNGFAGAVSLSVSGLPTEAAGSFSLTPVPGSGTSTLTVTTTTTIANGTYPLTITGTSGALTHSANVTLVVSASDFALSATPASRSVPQGNRASYTATVTPVSGFTGTVTFSVSGLPAQTSASFIPSTITGSGSTTMRVRTNGSTPIGTYTLTITGTSGALNHSTNVSLTVTTEGN